MVRYIPYRYAPGAGIYLTSPSLIRTLDPHVIYINNVCSVDYVLYSTRPLGRGNGSERKGKM